MSVREVNQRWLATMGLDDLLDMSTAAQRQNAALLRWHQLYRWPALRALAQEWPRLQAVP